MRLIRDRNVQFTNMALLRNDQSGSRLKYDYFLVRFNSLHSFSGDSDKVDQHCSCAHEGTACCQIITG